MCRLVQQDQGGIKCEGLDKTENGVCPDGKIPTLSRDNYEIWELFSLMLPGLLRMEGYDFNAIRIVFDVYGIEQKRRPEMLEQIIKIIGVIDAERRARRDHE